MAKHRYFSPSSCGFYSTVVHGQNLPADAVKITETEYLRLLQDQQEGKTIVARDGLPCAVDPDDDLEMLGQRNRVQRDRLLRDADWTQLPDSPLSPSQRAEWAAYRQQLRDIDLDRKLLESDWPTPPAGAA